MRPSAFQIFRLLTALAWLLAICSCGPATQVSRLSIGGGTIAEIATKSVVRIAMQGRSYCTGVLVASDLVVTAAHCLTSPDISQLSVVFPLAVDGKSRSVAGVQKVRDDSLLYFPNFDMAWIRLASNAPSNYEPAKILGNSAGVGSGTALSLVGVANETSCNSADSNCRIVQLSVKLKSIWSSAHLINLAVVESSNPGDNSGTCPGDSGGPAFVMRDGQALLFGIVAGKDPIFTGGVANVCGSPTSVLTRVGEYQSWIESTSQRQLSIVEGARNMISLDFLMGQGGDSAGLSGWKNWFEKPFARDTSWSTVHKILEQVVLEFQGTISSEQIPNLFQTGGQDWVERVATLRSLTLGFPDQSVAIDDLRPLEGLKNLEDLTFLARPYRGIEVLKGLKKLKNIGIVGRPGMSSQQSTLAWHDLASDSVVSLKLSQLPNFQLQSIFWDRFPKLKALSITLPTERIRSSILIEDKLLALESLQVQEFSCDQGLWPSSPMFQLKSLTLRSTLSLAQTELACINWANLPALKDLIIQGYRLNVAEFTALMPPALAAQVRASNP